MWIKLLFNMDKSIREIINDYRTEILRGDLLVVRAATILTELSALLGNVNDRITETDMEYNQVLLDCFDNEKTANRAKIKAGVSKEYKDMKDARNTEKVAVEIIRGLKFYLRAKEEEFRSGRYQ